MSTEITRAVMTMPGSSRKKDLRLAGARRGGVGEVAAVLSAAGAVRGGADSGPESGPETGPEAGPETGLETGPGSRPDSGAGPAAGGDEPALDRLAHGDDRVHPPARVAQAPDAGDGERHAAVQDEARAPAQHAGQDGERARAALVGVRHLDVVAPDHARQLPGRAQVERAMHRDRHVLDAGGPAAIRPVGARRRGDDDVMPAPGEPGREVAQLDRGAGEEVGLRIELQDPQRKNDLTASTTASISASVWPAEIGSVRISSTSRSVAGSAGGMNASTAGWRCAGTG